MVRPLPRSTQRASRWGSDTRPATNKKHVRSSFQCVLSVVSCVLLPLLDKYLNVTIILSKFALRQVFYLGSRKPNDYVCCSSSLSPRNANRTVCKHEDGEEMEGSRQSLRLGTVKCHLGSKHRHCHGNLVQDFKRERKRRNLSQPVQSTCRLRSPRLRLRLRPKGQPKNLQPKSKG